MAKLCSDFFLSGVREWSRTPNLPQGGRELNHCTNPLLAYCFLFDTYVFISQTVLSTSFPSSSCLNIVEYVRARG